MQSLQINHVLALPFPSMAKDASEQLKEHKRTLNASVREVERERMKLQRQENQIIADIKKLAKADQMGAVKVLAKDLVRTRNNIKRFYEMAAQISAIGLRLQTLKSSQDMAKTMAGAGKLMQKCNKKMNLPAMQKIMMEFEKNSEIMDMKAEMINESIDDAMADENEEEETENVVSQVLDEIGISLDQSMNGLTKVGAANASTSREKNRGETERALQERLGNLQK